MLVGPGWFQFALVHSCWQRPVCWTGRSPRPIGAMQISCRPRFPEVGVDAASLYRSHDRVYTSAGSAAGIDLLIEIVKQDFGPAAANSVARRLVMPAHRTGGQAQFLERPVAINRTGGIAPLLDRMRETLDQDWPVERMAREGGMSLRTLLRRFRDATGTTPGDWLIAERVEAAKELLCDSRLGIEGIAQSVGFGSAHALRHHFRSRAGVSPSAFRLRFLPTGQAVSHDR